MASNDSAQDTGRQWAEAVAAAVKAELMTPACAKAIACRLTGKVPKEDLHVALGCEPGSVAGDMAVAQSGKTRARRI
jgi:hypothetical protein